MNASTLLAILAGAAVAAQASMNARLGVLLHSSMWATAIAFGVSCITMLVTTVFFSQQNPTWSNAHLVPTYLWVTGGSLAALGVGLFYYLIPHMGIGPMMSYALCGQLLMAVLFSHFGWFDLPVKPFTIRRALGVIALLFSIVILNQD